MRQHSVLYTYLGTLRYRNKHRTVVLEGRRGIEESETEAVSLSAQVLDRLFNLTREHQVKTLFILEGFNNKRIKDKFLSYLSKNTDLIIDMDNYNKAEDLYIPLDGHWSASGNNYIAEIILEYISRRDLLQSEES